MKSKKIDNFLKLFSSRNFLLFLIDITLLTLAGLNALFVRFGFDFLEMSKYSSGVLVLVIITIISNLLNGTYRIVWRYATPKDLIVLLRGLFIGYAFTLIFIHFTRLVVLPRSVGMLTFLGSYFLLLSARIIYQYMLSWKRKSEKRIAIIGAGDAGVILLNEIKRTNYGSVVAFFDDDTQKIGKYVAGVKVLDSVDSVNNYIDKLEIDEILIAIPSASKQVMSRIISTIDTEKVKLKTFPSITEFLDRNPTITDLREISLQDIVGREPVNVDINSISKYLTGKTILITGAGGSIGSEISRQVCRFSPKKVVLVGRGENSIYEIYNELKEKYYELDIVPIISDVTDKNMMEKIFKTHRPDILFHAAAHKHVFFMQNNLYEALRVNVLGTINLAKLSCNYNVEKFVFISTDKAVHPTSYMGTSKRLAELYLLSIPDTCKTDFSIVRFGNVIGSRGSVLWKFKKQIENDEPVTITDPRMKRYWMSIPEAVSLVIQAGALSTNRELYVLDMGEQIPVEEVARALAKIMGKQNIKIKYTGAIPGEKLEEELFYEHEKPEKTQHPKIMRVEYNNFKKIPPEEFENKILEIMNKYIEGHEKEAENMIYEILEIN
ncbi:nucleoside-diphosphate sugar epimerase/dehydratase [Fervidobacterium sp. 2310opik-2]|uniref:polysaccharide biosynthesis protein n=1 Tax=Fervidobacterium sp. 2310opik-2 TaxID=1755815 RepID=UPI0013DECB6B|nr:nucleoside-diphosphate sugar epimerase/dehydratase [Fervidobacterium sp. 2310opik-2]KAF2962138.1 lipopolysaccharide biosynthesis protein [Fervidobacterium sp. 2310opik-2]